MEQRDRIIREISLMGQVFRKILGFFTGIPDRMKSAAEIEIVAQIFNEELNWNLDELMMLTDKDLVSVLKEEKKLTNEDLDKLAEIFATAAEKMDDNAEIISYKRNLLKKSLTLYLYLEDADNTFSMERSWKIEELKRQRGAHQ